MEAKAATSWQLSMLDNDLVLSDKQAVTVTAVSANVFQNNVSRDIGSGETVEYTVSVAETFAGLTSLEVQLIGSDNANLSSAVVVDSSGAIAAGDLTVGKVITGKVNPSKPFKYYGFNYVVAGTATAGKVTAYLGTGSRQGDAAAYASKQ